MVSKSYSVVLKGERHKRSYRSPNPFRYPAVTYVQLSRRSRSSSIGPAIAPPNPTPLSLPSLGVSSLDLGRLRQRRRPFFCVCRHVPSNSAPATLDLKEAKVLLDQFAPEL